ncbi:MAG: 3-keto-5-aminohexanoate cleavage protein [Deltaproteobacteria bacterium]|nr:3-keto-5-aminohexanoate cleavage protein [Deltaproteobacteria bacterium]
MEKLIVTCAITGAETTKEQNPALPTMPEEQAQAAYDCWKAGAAVIHLHVRDDSGRPSQSVERFQDTIEKIRKKCPVIIQISTGGAVGEKIENRAAPLKLKPEMASLNTGSINFGDEIFLNLPKDVEFLATRMKELKIRPEIEVYDYGMLEYSLKLMKNGVIPNPSHFQFVLGTGHGISGESRNLCRMADALPEECSWTAAGIGRYQLPVAAQAIVMGGHVRVGLEDNVFWSKGVLAKSNAQLVERVSQLAAMLQRPVANVEEARKFLCLG